jgi:hypothetical protein
MDAVLIPALIAAALCLLLGLIVSSTRRSRKGK